MVSQVQDAWLYYCKGAWTTEIELLAGYLYVLNLYRLSVVPGFQFCCLIESFREPLIPTSLVQMSGGFRILFAGRRILSAIFGALLVAALSFPVHHLRRMLFQLFLWPILWLCWISLP